MIGSNGGHNALSSTEFNAGGQVEALSQPNHFRGMGKACNARTMDCDVSLLSSCHELLTKMAETLVEWCVSASRREGGFA